MNGTAGRKCRIGNGGKERQNGKRRNENGSMEIAVWIEIGDCYLPK